MCAYGRWYGLMMSHDPKTRVRGYIYRCFRMYSTRGVWWYRWRVKMRGLKIRQCGVALNYINAYYNLHNHQRCLESHFRSESPTARFTTISFHPTRHLLFILPLSQPHLLSFHLFLLFWTCGNRSWLILCDRHLFLPISTLLLFIPFIITQSNPSLLHSLVSKQTLHTHSKT